MAETRNVIDCPECGEILSVPQCRPGACGLLSESDLTPKQRAADDLYAASEAIVAACERERPDIIGRDDEYIYDELGSAMSGAYVAARAALTKARGEA